MSLRIADVVLGTGATDSFAPGGADFTLCHVGLVGSGKVWVRYVGASSTPRLILVDMSDGSILVNHPNTDFGTPAAIGLNPLGIDPDGSAYVQQSNDGRTYKCKTDGTITGYFVPDITLGQGIAFDAAGAMWGMSGANTAKITNINYTTHATTTSVAPGDTRGPFFLRNAGGISGRIYCVFIGGGIFWLDTTTLAKTTVVASTDGNVSVLGTDGNIYCTEQLGAATRIRKYDQDGGAIASLDIAIIDLYVALYDSAGFLWACKRTAPANFQKIDPVSMTVVDTATPGNYLGIIAEPFANVPAAYSGATFGGLGELVEDLTFALTGVSATGAVGTLGVGARSLELTGVGAVASVGTLIAAPLLALTGLAATGSVGDLAVTNTQALTGNLATGSPGTLGVQINTNVTVALTGVQGVGAVGSLTAQGGAWPSPPFDIQVLMDGPRNIALKVASSISVDFPQSLLIDPMARSSIIPGWPTDRKATKLAVDLLSWNVPSGLRISLWWAAPVPELIVELEGVGHLNLTSKGFLQNITAGSPGQVLISSSGLSGTQTFSLVLRLIKQGAFG